MRTFGYCQQRTGAGSAGPRSVTVSVYAWTKSPASDTVAEPRALALLNGQPVVGFEVTRSKGASEIEVGATVQQALTELKAEHKRPRADRGF